MLRFDVGDEVPVGLQRYADEDLFPGDGSRTFFYSEDDYLFSDEASFMCSDNVATEGFFVVMIPKLNLDTDGYEEWQRELIVDCLESAEFENAVIGVVERFGDCKQQRFYFSIEYEADYDDEGYYYVSFAPLHDWFKKN